MIDTSPTETLANSAALMRLLQPGADDEHVADAVKLVCRYMNLDDLRAAVLYLAQQAAQHVDGDDLDRLLTQEVPA